MKDQSMTQRSGREILIKAVSNYHIEVERYFNELDSGLSHSAVIDEAERQLFNALLEIVKQVDADNDSNGRYNACREIEAKMRVFFGQLEASGKDGGKNESTD